MLLLSARAREADAWPLVGFIVMVDDFDAHNGATRFVTGSHLLPFGPNDSMGGAPSAQEVSDVTTNSGVNSPEQQAVPGVQEHVAQAAQLTAEQQADFLAEAKKELNLVVKALRGGNRENAVNQYLAGLHGLKFINLCRKAGKARAFATGELERDLSWWLGKSEKRAEKGTAKLEKRRSEADNGRDLPWQAQGENAAEKSTAKDLAEALYGIVAKHGEPEDVLYAMLTMHRKDACNAFKAAPGVRLDVGAEDQVGGKGAGVTISSA